MERTRWAALGSWKTGRAKHSQKACHNSQPLNSWWSTARRAHEQLNPKQRDFQLPGGASRMYTVKQKMQPYLTILTWPRKSQCIVLCSTLLPWWLPESKEWTVLCCTRAQKTFIRKAGGFIKAGPHPQKNPKSSEKNHCWTHPRKDRLRGGTHLSWRGKASEAVFWRQAVWLPSSGATTSSAGIIIPLLPVSQLAMPDVLSQNEGCSQLLNHSRPQKN